MYATTGKATRQEYLNGNDVEEPEHRRAAVFDLKSFISAAYVVGCLVFAGRKPTRRWE